MARQRRLGERQAEQFGADRQAGVGEAAGRDSAGYPL